MPSSEHPPGPPCRLCQSTDTGFLLSVDEFFVSRCNRCSSGSAHLAHRGAEEQTHDEFDDRYEADADHRKATLCWELLRRVVVTRPGQCILDVGCGRGSFLDVARSHGLRTVGLEPGKRAASSTASRHPVITAPLGAVTPSVGQFDLITLWDVLEHLDEPGKALASLRPLLSPNGSLVILTPMMGSAYDRLAITSHRLTGGRACQLVRMCWSEDHLTRFDPDGLRHVLEELGYSGAAARRVLLLSLRRDRYAGGRVLPRWTRSDVVNRSLSLVGVGLARAGHIHNKVLVWGSNGSGLFPTSGRRPTLAVSPPSS